MSTAQQTSAQDWQRHKQRVAACYTYYEHLSNVVGRSDYTDGMYLGDRTCDYESAQQRQAEYLLDEAGVAAGTRLLDLGCGRGRLLAQAGKRGAKAIGITISAEQVEYCTARGLDVRLLDYRRLPPDWNHSFDAVIANGSIEHFVSTPEGLARRASGIYRSLFETVHRLLDPRAPAPRLVTTVIHHRFRHGTKFRVPLRSKVLFGLLNRIYGGWYPLDGQLEHCSQGLFRAARAVDGTQDYLWTSEDFRRSWSLLPESSAELKALLGLVRSLAATGAAAPLFLLNPLLWTAQFRGDPPPVILRRHTWDYLRAGPP